MLCLGPDRFVDVGQPLEVVFDNAVKGGVVCVPGEVLTQLYQERKTNEAFIGQKIIRSVVAGVGTYLALQYLSRLGYVIHVVGTDVSGDLIEAEVYAAK